jgi:formate C-acetyltransferase
MNALDGYDNVGRLDQHLVPFYVHDVNNGTLTPDEATGILAEAFDIWGAHGHWQVVIGGTDTNGHDVSNELTRVILKARGKVKRPKPSLSLRLSTTSPRDLLDSALDLLEEGLGQPAIYNDDLYIRALQQIGIPYEAATQFVLGGCSETHIAGKSAARDAFFNLTKALEAVFYNGRVSFEGPRFGVETGPPHDLRTFEAFLTAYKRQVEYVIDAFVRYRNHVQKIVAGLQPALIRSLFVSGCLDSGLSNSAGGSEYDYGMIDVYGIPNVANSLLAVRKLVYEDRYVSMAHLVDALRRNFQNDGRLHALCQQLSKYGNDEDEVDTIAAHVADHVFEYVLRQRLWNGDGYYAFCASAPGAHVMFGKTTGATPDGRLAGTPLANSMGPMQGTDRSGPTAMLHSVSKLPLWKCIGTPVVNLSISPHLLAGEHRDTITALIQTFFRRGGMQLQVSVLDRRTLLDAMKHPASSPSLMVRVSGYAARLTELSPDIQEEIVSRTVC